MVGGNWEYTKLNTFVCEQLLSSSHVSASLDIRPNAFASLFIDIVHHKTSYTLPVLLIPLQRRFSVAYCTSFAMRKMSRVHDTGTQTHR